MSVLRPPVEVAVATREREVPTGPGMSYEPKLDGYRCLAFSSLGLLQSRQGSTSMTTRFPEVLTDVEQLGDVVVDGELVAVGPDGRLTFAALAAGPARRAREQVVVILVVFDLLARGDRDWRGRAYRERRAVLEALVPGLGHVQLIERTEDHHAARDWLAPGWGQAGVEGLVAKPGGSRYVPGRRSGWRKVRATITVDVAVLGVTRANTLVLALPDTGGRWRVRGVSLPVPPALRAELASRLRLDSARTEPVRVPGSAVGLPGSPDVVYEPVRLDTVVEIEADTSIDRARQRHPSRVLRIRDDLSPADLPPSSRITSGQ